MNNEPLKQQRYNVLYNKERLEMQKRKTQQKICWTYGLSKRRFYKLFGDIKLDFTYDYSRQCDVRAYILEIQNKITKKDILIHIYKLLYKEEL